MICSRIVISDDIQFDVMTDPSAEDSISTGIAKREYYDQHLVHLMLALIRPGDVVLDLGAHIGIFSLAAAAKGCQVVSVEASPGNVALLKASAERNGFHKIRIIHAAVCDSPKKVKFLPFGPYGQVATPELETRYGVPPVEVRGVPVDDLLAELGFNSVQFVKMDVEGSEVPAVQGMVKLLARADAPRILYESNRFTLGTYGCTPKQLINQLEKLGYQNYRVEEGTLLPFPSTTWQPEVVVDYLAVKQLPSEILGWRLDQPMTLTESIARVIAQCRSRDPETRFHIAKALASADPPILSDPAVITCLVALETDADQNVRTAANWRKSFDFQSKEELLRWLSSALLTLFGDTAANKKRLDAQPSRLDAQQGRLDAQQSRIKDLEMMVEKFRKSFLYRLFSWFNRLE